MKKGAIPVHYIIALILGIIVVGLLGYWFFVLGGRIPGLVTKTWCDERKHSYCTEWQKVGFESGREPADWDGYATGCTEIGIGEPTSTECQRLLIGLKPIGAACATDEECTSGFCNTATGKCE